MKCFCGYIAALLLLIGHPCVCKAEDDVLSPNLSKPVTLRCTDDRLHTVLDVISAVTGATLRSGRDERDWQVRDLPIVACAKDQPANTLVKAIAAATHLRLSSIKDANDTVIGYRLWRDKRRSDDIANFKTVVHEAAVAKAKWDWDVVSQLKDIPASQFDLPPDKPWAYDALNNPSTRKLSALMAALGPEGRDKLLSGQSVLLISEPPDDSTVSPALNYFQHMWTHLGPRADPPPNPNAPCEQIRGSIQLVVKDDLCSDIVTATSGAQESVYWSGLGMSIVANVMTGVKDRELPEQPPGGIPLINRADLLGSGFDEITSATELLQRKVKLEMSRDKETPTFADTVSALSEALDYTFVCEDFHSQFPLDRGYGDLFGKDVSVRDILDKLVSTGYWYMSEKDRKESMNPLRYWFVSEQDKLVVGIDPEWPLRHMGLIPESLLKNLKAKANGPGIELDDLAPLSCYPVEHVSWWIRSSRDLGFLSDSQFMRDLLARPIWATYSTLNRAQKARMLSEQGLTLSDLRQDQLEKMCQDQGYWCRRDIFYVTAPERFKGNYILPEEPDLLRGLALCIRRQPQGSKYRYWLELVGEGALPVPEDQPGLLLPMYSPEREAALKKENG